jgi:hypothetical protein
MKCSQRALRRHHRQRIKVRRMKLDKHLERTFHPMYIDTGVRCSCYCCGNPRKHFKEVSMQEKKHTLHFSLPVADVRINTK